MEKLIYKIPLQCTGGVEMKIEIEPLEEVTPKHPGTVPPYGKM
ncbi:MAG: hypothetical protein PVF58_03080 [Candidatus Methanofastidiosia archaeon]|jgi:hypothetical protein